MSEKEKFRCFKIELQDGSTLEGAWSLSTDEIYLPVPDEMARVAVDDGETVIDDPLVVKLLGSKLVRVKWLSEGTMPEMEAELEKAFEVIRNRFTK